MIAGFYRKQLYIGLMILLRRLYIVYSRRLSYSLILLYLSFNALQTSP